MSDGVITGIYRHFKEGKLYCVSTIGPAEWSSESLVVYHSLYHCTLNNRTRVRTESNFLETVERGDYRGPRFNLVMPWPEGFPIFHLQSFRRRTIFDIRLFFLSHVDEKTLLVYLDTGGSGTVVERLDRLFHRYYLAVP